MFIMSSSSILRIRKRSQGCKEMRIHKAVTQLALVLFLLLLLRATLFEKLVGNDNFPRTIRSAARSKKPSQRRSISYPPSPLRQDWLDNVNEWSQSKFSGKPTVKELFSKPPEEIQSFLGGIYEHSPWVAEELLKAGKFGSFQTITELGDAMKAIVGDSSRERKIELLCAHPDPCETVGKVAELTKESQDEQLAAGLQTLTESELERFTTANTGYRAKFSFPFILAVRNASKYTVLAALEGRLPNAAEQEFVTALSQVHKIAWMRLLAAINTDDAKGFLTCHVLDTANGCPAQKMRIHLHRITPVETAGLVAEYITNDDGRLEGGPALKGGKEFTVGTYVLTFFVSDYFASMGTYFPSTPFLDEVPIRFGNDNPDDHYHVPLLVSPWGFSTYRGS